MNKHKEIKIDYAIARTYDEDMLVCDGDICSFDEVDGLWDEADAIKTETFANHVTKLFFPASYKRMQND